MTPANAVLDLERLEDATGGDAEFLRELATIFLEDTQQRIEELNRALCDGDVASLGRTAHKLKGSCANVGALTLTELARNIEEVGRGRDLHELAPMIAGLSVELARVRDTLAEMTTR